MDGAGKQDAQEALRRLEELIAALDTHPDPSAAGAARELVAVVLELHGLGLAKLMAILAQADKGGSITARLVDNEHVRAMLLLHGLHPDGLDKRVGAAVERLRPHLGVHGLRLEVIGVVNGAVRLRLSGGAGVRAQLLWTIPSEIENAIFEAAPDVERVTIDGLEFPSLAPSNRAGE